MAWSGSHNLKDLNREKIPDLAGVYKILADRPICRLLGTDKEGILDIGESIDLRKRITIFRSCIKGSRKQGHAAGVRFRDRELLNSFAEETLLVRWKKTGGKDKRKAQAEEARLLQKYRNDFGENPPLNERI